VSELRAQLADVASVRGRQKYASLEIDLSTTDYELSVSGQERACERLVSAAEDVFDRGGKGTITLATGPAYTYVARVFVDQADELLDDLLAIFEEHVVRVRWTTDDGESDRLTELARAAYALVRKATSDRVAPKRDRSAVWTLDDGGYPAEFFRLADCLDELARSGLVELPSLLNDDAAESGRKEHDR
jgi:hypothetical protein